LAVAPIVALYFGIALNQLALVTNGGQMPVLVPGGCVAEELAQDGEDTIHTCMTPQTHLKFLCDWIEIGNPRPVYIMSPGDCFEFLYDDLQTPLLMIWFALLWADRSARIDNNASQSDSHT
jgi:hypothetical protein